MAVTVKAFCPECGELVLDWEDVDPVVPSVLGRPTLVEVPCDVWEQAHDLHDALCPRQDAGPDPDAHRDMELDRCMGVTG